MKRQHLILVGVLVLQILLTLFVFWPRPAEVGAGEALFPDLDPELIVSLSIVDDQRGRIELRRIDDEWVLPEAGNYPAKSSTIDPVLQALAALDTSTLVARTEASRERLQVAEDDFIRRLIFEQEDGSGRILYLGTSPRYSAVHVRRDGQDEIYLTDRLSAWTLDTAAASWVDTTYFMVPPDEVLEIEVRNEQGSITLLRDGEGAAAGWTLKGLEEAETLAANEVATLASRATAVNLLRPLGKAEQGEYGMDEPAAVITLRTADEAFILTVGAHDPDRGSYVVKSSTSPYYVTVSEANVQPLVESAREVLLQAETTPAPTLLP
ncbi:MAG: DUF4340 domain-containing protein [Anaerolineales bacterium]